MKINDIATGTITVELQPDEAMEIAIACHLAEQAVYSGHTCGFASSDANAREKRYETLCATFEALAVAGNAQYCIGDNEETVSASLSALRAVKR